MEVTATCSILSKGRLILQGMSDGEATSVALSGLLDMRYGSVAPRSHPAESPFNGMLLNAAGTAAADLSNQWDAASSGARAAEYPHSGVLSLRYIPSHC